MVKDLVPEKNRVPFFVYIIESPNPADIYHSRFEADLLKKALDLNSIHCSYRITVNKEAFIAAIKVGLLQEQISLFPKLVPVIHISAHGGQEGLALTNGEFISWEELKDLMFEINKALNGNLLICISACEGFTACKMAMDEAEELPFFGLVAHQGKPRWSDTAIAYASFYHLIAKGYYLKNAVEGMCQASGEDGFIAITANEAKQAYIKFLKEGLAQNFQQAMQQDVQENPPSPEAKLLEKQ